MQYKIIKKEEKKLIELSHFVNGNIENEVKVKHYVWYEARRKGTIFGFWHDVGHPPFNFPYIAKTIEEMEDYIKKWHEVNYFGKPIEIVKDINL